MAGRVAVPVGLVTPLAAAAALGIACGGGHAPPGPAVNIVYLASTTIDPDTAQRFSGCVQDAGKTHVHASWHNYARTFMVAAGDRWTLTFTDVPVGRRQDLRVSDPNLCSENPTGAATRNVFVNGVELTEIVSTPGFDPEPGLGFTVAADGTITP